jgi:Putative transposase, YhgA-like
MTENRSDYDSAWKEALERFFEEFISFFFPEAHSGIDWSKGYEFLDKELQQVVRDAELGRRLADKLVKVWSKDGEEAWVLVHIEVQANVDTSLAKRMYVYNYRIFDRYDRKVASLAVLADRQAAWRPSGYGYTLWGCKVGIEFPVVKLLDHETRRAELEQNLNPFAIIVMAHLKTQATHSDEQGRLQWKLGRNFSISSGSKSKVPM